MGQYEVLYPLERSADPVSFFVRDSDRELVLRLLRPATSACDPLSVATAFDLRRSLTHPLLPPPLGIGWRGRRPGFFYDHLPKIDVDAVLRSPATAVRPLQIAIRMADLLCYLHARRHCAGYLTPDRLLGGTPEELQVIVDIPGGTGLPRDPESFVYCGPQLLRTGRWTAGDDIFSLGRLFYRLFTGRRPISERDTSRILSKQLTTRPVHPRSVAPDLPEPLAGLIESMIRRHPSERPGAVDVHEALVRLAGPCAGPAPTLTSPLIGRRSELRKLAEACADLRQHASGRVLVIRGAEGVGKSRMLEALVDVARASRLRVFHCRSQERGVLVSETGAAGAVEPSHSEYSESVAPLIKLAAAEPAVVILTGDVETIPSRILLDLVGASAGVLIALEAHREVSLPSTLTTSSRTPVEVLDLPPLAASRMEQLACRTLGRQPGRQSRSLRTLQELGRPLYWHELADRMAGDGDLLYRAGAWISDGEGGADEAPNTLAQQLSRRLADLTQDASLLLEGLAAVADPQPFQVLLHLGDWTADQLEQLLREVTGAELVSASGELEDTRFGIEHSWIRDMVEAAMSEDMKRLRHGRVARALTRFAAESNADAEIHVTIAEQLIAAGSDPEPHFSRALACLKQQQQFARASRLMDRALEAGVVAGNHNEHIELLLLSGELRECARLINRCLSRKHTDPRQRAHLYWMLGRMHLVRGERRKAIGAFEHALTYSPHTATLDSELKCELLCLSAVSARGRSQDKLRSELEKRAEAGGDIPEKLWHALFVDAFFGPDGSIDRAIRYGTRSIEVLANGGDSVRLLGRIFNLSHSLLQAGRYRSGRRLDRFVQRATGETGNRELMAYAEMSRLLNWRREGNHSQILQRTRQHMDGSREVRANPHLVVERQLERVKSLLYTGRLDEANRALVRLERSPLEFQPSDFELQLIRGWWLWTIGRRDDAERVARELRRERPHHFYGRSELLLARCLLDKDPASADRAARRALLSFSSSSPYYRAKALLALAEVLGRQGSAAEATELMRRARKLIPTGRYPALTAAIVVTRASQQRRGGDLQSARALCLRALQLVRSVERPLLASRILVELARVELEQGQRRVAASRLDQAIAMVRSVADVLPPPLRSQFSKSRLNPLLVLSWRLFRGNLEMPSDLLGALTRFSQGEKGSARIAESVRAAVAESLPNASVRVCIRSPESGELKTAASRGALGTRSRELIREARDRRDEALITRFQGGTTVCALPLRKQGALLGLIHLETPDELIEAELDFLSCLATLTTFKLPAGDVRQRVPARSPAAVTLRGGRTLIARSRSMQRVLELARRVAASKATVIVEGETGTGKELVSRLIHDTSPRRRRAFVPLHCGALPEELIENELFGNLEGSFTGARGKPGLFEAADGGTLFLDEIASMPLALQSRLLRVLQEGRIRRIGAHSERAVDVRVVAATNRSLRELVAGGEFRDDLFHRLNVFRIEIPPLRDRPDDIGPLADHFLEGLNQEHGKTVSISSGGLQWLRSYHFPGNVRELQNLIESLFYMCPDGVIGGALVRARIDPEPAPAEWEDRIEGILSELKSGRVSFWEAVRKPFLDRDLSRREVRRIVAAGLADCDGSYRRLTRHFGIAAGDYKKLLNFLRDHDCRVDFRPYREQARER